MGAWESLCSKKTLWALKLEFHIIVTLHSTILLLIFKKKNKVETIPSSEIKQKQVAGYIWLGGYSLLTHGLNYSYPNISLCIQ